MKEKVKKKKDKAGRKGFWNLIKKRKKAMKSIISVAGFALVMNNTILTMGYYWICTDKSFRDYRIQEATNIDKYIQNIPKNGTALELLKSAHAVTTVHLDYRRIKKFEDIWVEKEIALYSSRADCSYFSVFTYSNFLYLCNKFHRPDLRDNVRLAIGNSGNEGHQWIEIKINNEWKTYETTVDKYYNYTKTSRPYEYNLIDFKNINSYIKDEEVLDIESCFQIWSCQETSEGKSKIMPGKYSFRKGIASFLYKDMKPIAKQAIKGARDSITEYWGYLK